MAIHQLMSKPVFSASEARKLGVHPSLIQYYIDKNVFERIGRGCYRGVGATFEVDFQWEDLVLTAKSVPNGIICLVSALALYGLTDEIPRAYWIAISHATTAPKRPKAKFIRMRNVEMGVTQIRVGNEVVAIFDIERTIVDAFRFLSKEIAIKALKEAVRTKQKIDFKKIERYSKKLRINIDPYILAVMI